MNDPCCDPESCLLRPWATCRTGACCLNCTVRPSSHVCRQPLTECDVPEFCSGMTGKVSDTFNIINDHYVYPLILQVFSLRGSGRNDTENEITKLYYSG